MRPLLAVGAVAAALRIVYTLVLGRHVELGISDATFYSGAANHLARGDGFIDVWRSLAEGTTLQTAHHPPGWPALLSVFSLLGVESEVGHRLVGAVLGGVVVVLLGLVAWRVAGRTAGLLAAALGAVHPTLVAADGSLMAETLAGAFVLLVVLAGLWVADGPTPRRALVLGLTIGAGALVRGEMLLYLVLVALPLAVLAARRAPDAVRTFARVGLPAAVGVVAVVLPWTIRNTLLFDEPVLISINDSLRANRGRLPAVVVARMARTWGVRDVLSPVAEGRHLGTQSVGNVVWLAALLPGGVTGAVVLARRRRTVELLLLLAPIVAATAVTVLGFGMLRFRHPMELATVVLTAVALTALLPRRAGDAGEAPAECAPLPT